MELNGLEEEVLRAEALLEDEERGLMLAEFLLKYPCDDRAVAYLESSSKAVLERAVKEFRPKREGEEDYSALVVTFVKNIKNHTPEYPERPAKAVDAAEAWTSSQGELEEFRLRFPVDEDAFNYLLSSPSDVQRLVLRDFRPPREDSDYSALLIKFTKRVRENARSRPHPGAGHAVAPLAAAGHSVAWPQPLARGQPALPGDVQLRQFRERYPFDDEAYSYLASAPPHVQEQVIQNFSPKREGEDDYSALVITFVKRCRNGLVPSAPPPQLPPQAREGFHAAYGGGGYHRGPEMWEMMSTPTGLDELYAFRERYPLDEEAFQYLSKLNPGARSVVLHEFKPPREGEADYSALVISFAKKVREKNPPQGAAPRMSYAARAAPYLPGPHGGYAQGPAWGGYYGPPMPPVDYRNYRSPPAPRQPLPQPEPPDLHAFRLQYPMDDRAFAYLEACSAEVQWHVVETFKPRNPDDTDYSAPVVSYAKICRQRAPDGGLAPPVVDVEIFQTRYPIDQRAMDYLMASPPEVIARIVREFKPKHEGESDYSGAVVAFTKRCGGGPGNSPDFGVHNGAVAMRRPYGGAYAGPPPKRPRY